MYGLSATGGLSGALGKSGELQRDTHGSSILSWHSDGFTGKRS